MSIPERLTALRKLMKDRGIDGYIIPSSDPHQSEYVAAHWQARTWITGFTGSAGTAALTHDQAGLWTDSRYFIQAEEQLADTGVDLHKVLNPTKPGFLNWLIEQLPEGSTIGVDGRQFSASQLRHFHRKLKNASFKLQADVDLIGDAWKDRPPLPKDPIFEHPLKYAGETTAQKMEAVRQHLQQLGLSQYLITGLDDIAWLFNLRGKDVECNPVFYAYAIISQKEAHIFIDIEKVPDSLCDSLGASGIELHAYDTIEAYCNKLPEGTILLHAGSTNARLYDAIPDKQIIEGPNIVRHLKAIKNNTEVSHLREAMRKDGVALLRLYRWLEDALNNGETVTEAGLSDQLNEFRAQQDDYFGESFNAIVGYAGNGAIVHYRPMHGSSATLKKEGVLLLDSGGQYIDGTTDITRTTALGKVSEEAKLAYTMVLKGHIALANIRFPEGTTGVQLDTLARMHLWNQGMNYGHGTGHGVGFFLNVHEPPQGFVASASNERGNTPFRSGMLTSNEPGYYLPDAFGIRIENLILCVPAEETASGKFLKFETLTYFPIETDMVLFHKMAKEEIQWLNDYHAMVWEELSPRLEGEEKEWLEERCQAV